MVPPCNGPELGCSDNCLQLPAPDTTWLIPSALKSCPLLLTSTVRLPAYANGSNRQCTSDVLTYLVSLPTLHLSSRDSTKCLPVTRSTRLSTPSASWCTTSSTPVTVGARSYTNCTPLDVRSAPLLLTSTDTVCSDPALGASHTILLDVSNRPSVITLSDPPPPSPDSANMHPSPDPALKPDPSTCTIVDPSTAPADGTIPDTTTGASYSKASSEPCDACSPSSSSAMLATPSSLRLGVVHSISRSPRCTPSTTIPPEKAHSTAPVGSHRLPEKVTIVPPLVGPLLGLTRIDEADMCRDVGAYSTPSAEKSWPLLLTSIVTFPSTALSM